MAGLNKVILIGNLGKDPEIHLTEDGLSIAKFSIATSERWKDKNNGEMQERTEWHRIVAFGKLAKICGDYLLRGKQVYIEGRIQNREWEDEKGNKRFYYEIVAFQMLMLGAKNNANTD